MIPIAHGLVARSDLPIPEWLFGWAAAMVLVVSFAALAVLWPEPRSSASTGAAPGALGRVLGSRPLAVLCGAIGVLLLGVVVYSGLRGTQSATANFAPTFVYVAFWLGLVAASVLLGDVFRAFNPWRAAGRAVAFVARLVSRTDLPAPLPYPERLGRWPAAAGILAFAALELVASNGDNPENVAIATLIYSAATFVAMALYGGRVDRARGGLLGVLQSLLAAFGGGGPRRCGRTAAAAVGCGGARPDAGHGGAAGGDDRLSDLRRRRGGARVDQRRAGHRVLLRGPRPPPQGASRRRSRSASCLRSPSSTPSTGSV